MTTPVIVTIVIFIAGLFLGIIGFFLKRTMARVDANEKEIREIKETFARREELRCVEQSSAQAVAKLEQRMNERFDKTTLEIKGIKDEVRDDLIREIGKLDLKMQRIYDLLIEGRKQ